MNIERSHLAYALGTLVMGTALFFAGPASVLADASNDISTQPHLKSWSNIIPAAKRFVVLADFNNQAVLDRETGLVWEKSPDTIIRTWFTACTSCLEKNVGGRKAWRLPSIVELLSLVDPTQANPSLPLPAGHPFTNIQSAFYWSATTDANRLFPDFAWFADFSNGGDPPSIRRAHSLSGVFAVQ